MTVEYPAALHIPGLRSLWKEAFGDTDTFLDGFFTHGFSPRRCRCITENGGVLAALYWFECTFSGQRFAYLYAVATAKSHRGRGLFAALLADTKRILEEDGFGGILLVPEDEGLAKMYEKLGFSPCTTVDHHTVSAGKASIEASEIGPDSFAKRRREMLPEGGVLQEGATLSFLASQCRFWAGSGWLAAGQVYDGKLICQEFLGDESAMGGLLRALDVTEGAFRTPGKAVPFAWLLPLHGSCERPNYFSLALD